MQISQLNGNDLVMRGGLLLDAIFPVGSVYVSSNNQSPAQFLGGTWERVEEVFSLFAGTNYAAGSKGGNANVTLIEANLAPHSHVEQMCFEEYTTEYGVRNLGYRNGSADGPNKYWNTAMPHGGSTAALSTKEAGEGEPFSVLPPYKAFYAWERIE